MDAADVNWCNVLAHHAAADAGQGPHAVRGRGHDLRADGRPRRRAGGWPAPTRGRNRRRGGDPVVQLPRVPRSPLRVQLSGGHRHADQLAPGRSRGALHPRPLGRAGPGLRRRPCAHWRTRPLMGSETRCCGSARHPSTVRIGRASATSGTAPRRPSPVAAAGDDVHRLMYTSGTTGRPKGVMLTHANLAWKNLAHIVEFGFTSADLGLACGPLYHVGALDLTTTSLIAAGATTIVHRAFDAAAVVDEVERSRTSLWSGWRRRWSTPSWRCPTLSSGISRRSGSSSTAARRCRSRLIERIQRVFPRPGSPTPTA